MSENYLVHFGTKGMKWGVRRYQNPDGSLTEEGKRHYRTNLDYQIGTPKQQKRQFTNDDYNKVKDTYNKNKNNIYRVSKSVSAISNNKRNKQIQEDVVKMSDSELRTKVNRLRLESQYKQLIGAGNVMKGKDYVRESLEIIGGLSGIAVSAITLYSLLNGKKS